MNASPLFDGVNKPDPVLVEFAWNAGRGTLTIGGVDGWARIPTTATFGVKVGTEHPYTQFGSSEPTPRGELILTFNTGGLTMHLRNPRIERATPDGHSGTITGELILDRAVHL